MTSAQKVFNEYMEMNSETKASSQWRK